MFAYIFIYLFSYLFIFIIYIFIIIIFYPANEGKKTEKRLKKIVEIHS